MDNSTEQPLKLDVRSGLRKIMRQARRVDLKTRARSFEEFWHAAIAANQSLYFREIIGPQGREVTVRDGFTGEHRQLVMFGSNNYLGLADHPYVKEQSIKALERFGTGVGGPPLLNGYTLLMRELEERLAVLKGAEAAIIYPTGYQSNLSLVTCLPERGDLLLCDEGHHASLYDGLKMAGITHNTFKHNDLEDLEEQLIEFRSDTRDAFVFIESVHSMDSDLAPIPAVAELCRRYSSYLIVDDAHGTGVLGERGHGVGEHFNMEGDIDVVMGTFSKAFASVGGFVTGPSHIIAYLKFYSRPYMFSAALPPTILAGVHACLDILEREPERVQQLHDNVQYVVDGLRDQGISTSSQGGCVPLIVPAEINIRKAAFAFHEMGFFMNPIEWPAVPKEKQRFRISLIATHTREDLDRLLEAIEKVWSLDSVRE